MKRIIIISLIIISVIFSWVFLYNNSKTNETVTVKFSSWGSKSETDIIKGLIKEFENQNPDIKIDFIHIPQNYFQKIQLLFASNIAPDVVFINNQNIQMYINADLLEDLSSIIDKDYYFKESLQCFSKNGKIYDIFY